MSKPDKQSLTELTNVLLTVEKEFPPEIRISRHGDEREMFVLYKDEPNVFFDFGKRVPAIEFTMVVPREMLELKEGRGAAMKAFTRVFVKTIEEAMADFTGVVQ